MMGLLATRFWVVSSLGVELDVWLDGKGEGVRLLSEPSSRVAVYVAPAEEDRMIAVHVMNMTAR
jgi:acetate kinase